MIYEEGIGSIRSGIMGGGGVIRIVTDPALRRDPLVTRSFQSYEVPLAFGGGKKQFYTPVYSSYNSEFFEAFGTLGSGQGQQTIVVPANAVEAFGDAFKMLRGRS